MTCRRIFALVGIPVFDFILLCFRWFLEAGKEAIQRFLEHNIRVLHITIEVSEIDHRP